MNAGVGPCLVVRYHDADRPPTHEQRDVKPGMDAHAPGRLLVDLRIIEQRVDPLTPTALEHAAGLGAAEGQFDPGHAVRALAFGRGDAQHVTFGECDQDELRVDQLLQPARHETQERLELELRRERVSHFVEGLELAQPTRRVLVQPSVLDRHSGLRRKQLRKLRVLVAEVLSARLLGQVQVPIRDTAKDDRHAEERLHRRMVVRKPDRARVVGDVVEPQRLRVADQDAEDAAPMRQIADRGVGVRIDPGRQEALERLPSPVDHAESCVASVGDLRGSLDDPLQQRVERKLGAERDAGVHENAQTAELVRFAAHRSILAQKPLESSCGPVDGAPFRSTPGRESQRSRRQNAKSCEPEGPQDLTRRISQTQPGAVKPRFEPWSRTSQRVVRRRCSEQRQGRWSVRREPTIVVTTSTKRRIAAGANTARSDELCVARLRTTASAE